MATVALAGVPTEVCMRPVDAFPCSPAEAVRRVRGLRHPVVLAGSWAAGDIVLAADPILLEVSSGRSADTFGFLDRQPQVSGQVPEGAVGGGWFGWFGFEVATHAFGFYPNVLRLAGGRWWDEALTGVVPEAELEERRRLLREVVTGAGAAPGAYRLGPVTPSRDRAGHVAAVERCIQHIRDGEIYQANICLTLEADFAGEPGDLAADLLASLQPPYGAFLALGDRYVASASPELFLRRSGRQVTSTPIKGTRPRTPDTAEAERERLIGSKKDRAENIMIVDLVRNDLSRVAEIGSVRVDRLLDVVEAPGVWHLVSSIEATLREPHGDADLLRATFPPGSVSGAPKSRAVDIIAELEDRPRGVYTGAIGYASPVAGAEFSVAIRTAQIADGTFSLGVGGGITVDSTPVQEWWECFDKARPLLAAIGGRLNDPTSVRDVTDPRAAGGICDTTLLRFGIPQERAEHLARLERGYYELYQQPLPQAAADALLKSPSSSEPWQRQRVDVSPDGKVAVTKAAVSPPQQVSDKPGETAVLLMSDGGFGSYKWADRRSQAEFEQAYPRQIVILRDEEGLLESTTANVIAVIDGRLVTAPLDGRVLPGVTRTVVLELARDLGIGIDFQAPDHTRASALAVVSSVAGMRWIRRCGDVVWGNPGDLLSELSRSLIERWSGRATVAK